MRMLGAKMRGAIVLLLLWRTIASLTPGHPLFAIALAVLVATVGAALAGAFPQFDALLVAIATDEDASKRGWAIILRVLAALNLANAYEVGTTCLALVGSAGLWPGPS